MCADNFACSSYLPMCQSKFMVEEASQSTESLGARGLGAQPPDAFLCNSFSGFLSFKLYQTCMHISQVINKAFDFQSGLSLNCSVAL